MQVSTSECSVSLLGIPRSYRRDLHQMAPDQTKWYITLNGQESVRERFGVGFFGVTEVLWSDHSFKQAELRAVSKVSLWPEQYGVSKIDLYISGLFRYNKKTVNYCLLADEEGWRMDPWFLYKIIFCRVLRPPLSAVKTGSQSTVPTRNCSMSWKCVFCVFVSV